MARMSGPSIRAAAPAPTAAKLLSPSSKTLAGAAAGVIVMVMLAQTVFLLWGCDWDLCSDEAEFWAWSRKLDWSYYARGPVVAWLIRLGTELFGGLSLKLTGSMMFAVRFPCVVLGGLTAWAVYRLAVLTTQSQRVALISALLLPVIPIFALGGVIVTSDTPLCCCWAWAAVWTYRALSEGRFRAWVAAGAIGAVGVLAKYSFLAFPVSVGLYMVLSAKYRPQLLRAGFWVMSLLCCGMGILPIWIWNAQHGWAGGYQLADRVGLSSRAQWGSVWPVMSFLGGEALALGVIWWVVGLVCLAGISMRLFRVNRRVTSESRESADDAASVPTGVVYLLCQWGVLWCACLVASVLGETEVNWMVPGYLSLVVLIAARVGQILSRGGWKTRAVVAGWTVSLAAVIAVHHMEWFYPAFDRWVPAPTNRWAAPFRLIEPTARFRGHQVLARAVAEKVRALQARGESPYVLTATYGLTSTLSFYLPDQPETYCLSWNFGMTAAPVNQHDLWHPNPRHEPDAFKNRPAIIVEDSNMPPSYALRMHRKGVFGKFDSTERLKVQEHGVLIGVWDIAICRDYRGLAEYKQNRFARSIEDAMRLR